jgi:hypothetical protein
MTEAADFLSLLFGAAESGWVDIWTLPDRYSRFFKTDRLATAAEYAVDRSRTHDVYIACGLRGRDHGPHARGKAEDVVAIPGLWADVDCAKPGARRRYFPTREAAAAFLRALPIPPTLWIWSGGGWHVWWTFRERWHFTDADDRVRAAGLLAGWQGYLAARAAPHSIDPTHDLTRVLRPPQTCNHKYGTTVELVSADGPRAEPSDFTEWCADVPVLPPARASVTVSPRDATLSAERLEALLANDPKFAATWRGERADLRDRSLSGLDLALASRAALAGLSDAEIVALLVEYRRQHGGVEKLARAEYLARTLARARTQRRVDGATVEVRPGGLRVRRV